MSECGTVRVGRAIEVGAGVFAPGHVGALTSVVPFELLDAVLVATGRVQRRLRDLPSRVGVYLVLAMALFPEVGVAGVWRKLVGGLAGLPVVCPSEKALRDLRRRVGAEPVRALFETVAGPLAWPGMAGVCYRRWRTVAVDGCMSFKVPDTERNRGWFGYGRSGQGGYPCLALAALVETGTRGLIGAAFGPIRRGETVYAGALVPLLGPDMLLLADRGFDADEFLSAVAGTGAQFLVRVRVNRKLPVLLALPDGSFLTTVAGLALRVITARIEVAGADGSRTAGQYLLMTTLTDHRVDPASALVGLYHERWEIEVAFLALRHRLTGRDVLRSGDPAGIDQEMWALLTVYQALRMVMVDAIASQPRRDPDRAAFTAALAAARDSLTCADTTSEIGLSGAITTAVLATAHPPRRPRYSARVQKSPGSRYPHTRPDNTRPTTSTQITAVQITILRPPTPTIPRPDPTLVAQLRSRYPATGTPVLQAIAILHATPDTPRQARELARMLGITGRAPMNSFGVAMSKKAHHGAITKTSPGTYTAPPTHTLTPPPQP